MAEQYELMLRQALITIGRTLYRGLGPLAEWLILSDRDDSYGRSDAFAHLETGRATKLGYAQSRVPPEAFQLQARGPVLVG